MASEIKIRWDGDVPGISDRRLSLAAFGEPLKQLLAALRRIATQMVGTAAAGEQERARVGRFANLARQLDIEISSIEGGSAGFNGTLAFYQPPEELPLFADLPDRAMTELMDSVERESNGQMVNGAVRNYLASLPPGVNKQTYELYDRGVLKKTVKIGHVNLPALPEAMPNLQEVEGSIVGVGFEPGRSEVRVKGQSSTVAFEASDEQVEKALAIRKEFARLLGVNDGRRTRLLRIQAAADPRFRVTPEAIEQHIFERWSGVFARLAK